MEQNKLPVKVNHYPSNHPWIAFAGIVPVCGALLLLMAKYSNGSREDSELLVICGSLSAGLFLWSIFNLCRSVWLSEEGISFRFLRRTYKTVSWDQISQVGTLHKRKNTGYHLVLTPCGVPKYDTDWPPARYLVENPFHLILLDATPENVAAIDWHYGFLDYDTRK